MFSCSESNHTRHCGRVNDSRCIVKKLPFGLDNFFLPDCRLNSLERSSAESRRRWRRLRRQSSVLTFLLLKIGYVTWQYVKDTTTTTTRATESEAAAWNANSATLTGATAAWGPQKERDSAGLKERERERESKSETTFFCWLNFVTGSLFSLTGRRGRHIMRARLLVRPTLRMSNRLRITPYSNGNNNIQFTAAAQSNQR